ncbi:integral membrane protein [Yersinia pseudotuberculosis]|nr:integral membrane protein [Yersinia pseudotuberculosis]CNB37700.1 integral membrane protein [Yersinia pseudotuberculosis]CNB52152.1 integral membrane protein [Yersinia pseudotuberculosis]CRY59061.1 integral membrane protein [Yersinia pseudotuberculosis]
MTFGLMALAYGYREQFADSLQRIYRLAAKTSAILMLTLTLLCLVVFNPIWSAQQVGGLPLLNMVTVAYAIPMVFMVVALRYWPDHWLDIRLKPYVIGAIALLGMVFITLTVRQLWHGDRLDNDIVYSGEQYSYSLAWMLTAIGMMYSAIHWPNYKVRRASLGLLALTIVKLFLWDMSGLEGLYRSVSFLGLGLCLVAIGWFYQKFVVMKEVIEQNKDQPTADVVQSGQ